MIVPLYWAEARRHQRHGGRSVTVRRFGWSDASAEEAQRHADQRAAEALRRVLAGEKLPRREPKVPYHGAEGVPIREEILARHGDVIVTRNAYGAHCLNTPDVLFADVDFVEAADLPVSTVFLVALGVVVGALTGYLGFRWAAIPAGLVAMAMVVSLFRPVFGPWRAGMQAAERRARARVTRFIGRRPDWNLRLYRTPAGFRVLATHRTFDPLEPDVAALFRELRTDPIYVRMCRNQRCFRARLTAKPWRAGIQEHLRPRPGVWPVAPERLHLRRAWVERYEIAAAKFAACRFIESVGSGVTAPAVARVQALHDDLSRATTGLPLA